MEHIYLKTFYEVVKAGHATKAAETEILCVTQPTVSRRMKLLEKLVIVCCWIEPEALQHRLAACREKMLGKKRPHGDCTVCS